MPTKKIEPELDQVLEAGLKSSGVNSSLAQRLANPSNPPLSELLNFQKRVNANLANEKAAAESGDFD